MCIIKDYWKANFRSSICLIIQAALFPILIVRNINTESTSGRVWIILACLFEVVAVWLLINLFIIQPIKFKATLKSLPDCEKIIGEYPTSKRVESHVFLEDYMIILYKDRPHLLKYTDITALEKQKTRLKLTIKDYKKRIVMPFSEYGVNAITAAYIKSKNPEVKLIGSAD